MTTDLLSVPTDIAKGRVGSMAGEQVEVGSRDLSLKVTPTKSRIECKEDRTDSRVSLHEREQEIKE